MILVDLPPGTTLFRALAPQWASRPTSGAGAAANGGRFNREGIEALYFSLDEVTALREYQQTSPVTRSTPASVSYRQSNHRRQPAPGSGRVGRSGSTSVRAGSCRWHQDWKNR